MRGSFGGPSAESLICTSWPQLTATQPGLWSCSSPSNVVGQPGVGDFGAGNRTWTPLLARAGAVASSRNCSRSEKSPYGRAANHSTPSPAAPGPVCTVPSRWSVAEAPPAYFHCAKHLRLPSRITR